MGNIIVMFLCVSIKRSFAPENLPAGLTSVLLAQVDLVFLGHVRHLVIIGHFSAAEVTYESLLSSPGFWGNLWDFQVCLLPNLLIVGEVVVL